MPTPTATPTPGATPLFVRIGGDDGNDGHDPAHALRTITAAAHMALRNYQVIVGPGTYLEGVTTDGSGRSARAVTFVADELGVETGDAPGPVIIDATGSAAGAGFRLSSATDSVIDGFRITGGADGGIVIKSGSDDFVVRNCILFDNPGSGIRAQDSARPLIFNNLVYDNGGQGIAIVGQTSGSPDARLFSNTIVGNGNRGITVGTSQVASPGALIRNNIVQDNGNGAEPSLGNIKVFTTPPSDTGYNEDFNLVFPPSYTPIDVAGRDDIDRSASFEFPGGGNFLLRTGSPAIDAGDALPRALETLLKARTATGRGLDRDRLDLGYHAPPTGE
jgi:parallel beta-helix repeat protein